jgi:hypothetical protein
MELMAHQQIRGERRAIFVFEDSYLECKKLSGRMYTNYGTLREKTFPAKHTISGYKMIEGTGANVHIVNELLIF